MGVPSFYRWLVSKYPDIVCKVLEQSAGDPVDLNSPNPNGIQFDNLYLDMNGIIHPCFHPEDNEDEVAPTTYEEVFERVFSYIDRLFGIVRPRKLLYLAIDGVAPRAKMNQQRTRRFRSGKEKHLSEAEEDRLRNEFEKQGKMVLPKVKCEVNDSNVITPGTEFLSQLAEALYGYISSRMSTDASWKQIKVILSDANVPGEGEHKIMSFIRQQRAGNSYEPNTRHCLYGLDADLIMLALATHEVHFSLIREDIFTQDHQSWNAVAPNKRYPCEKKKPFEFLHIWLLREYLELDITIKDLPENIEYDFERIVDDFVFMCFFAGNDFLPHMPTLDIKEGAVDLMMDVYKRDFKTRGGYLIDMSKVKDKHNSFIKLKRVEHFITSIGSYEEAIFNKRTEWEERKLKQFLRYHSEPEEDTSEICEADDNTSFNEETQLTQEPASAIQVVANTKELKHMLRELMKKKSDLFRSGDFRSDKVKLGKAGWKRRYYAEKFLAQTSDEFERTRTTVIQKYTEGLMWVLQYYFYGVPSWTWFYPFHYGPFASDFAGMSKIKVKFTQGSPFKPFDQLMAVLPPSSAGALPQAYQNLMTNKDSSIADFYLEDFDIDVDGKRFLWQGISKLSFIDEERLLSETKELEKKLEGEDALRNKVSNDRLFIRTDSDFGESLLEAFRLPSSSKSELLKKFDSKLSDGLCGQFRSLLTECDSTKNNVLCVVYEEPIEKVVPSYRPLNGVIFPDKTITESDIVETKLWHTVQRTHPQSTTTSFSSQSPSSNAGKGRGDWVASDKRNTYTRRGNTDSSRGFARRGGRQNNNFWASKNEQESTSRRW